MPAAIATIGAGLSAVKTSFDLIKGVREKSGQPEINPSEVQARLLEIQSLLIDAQKGLADAEEENRKLRGRIEEMERAANFGKDFKFEEGVYWHREYPYCPNCWDASRTPTRLDGPFGGNSRQWRCPVHKSPVRTSGVGLGT